MFTEGRILYTRAVGVLSVGKESSQSWFVYMVRCADDSLYTGIAVDVAARIETHNAGKGARYTRSRLPVRLVHREHAANRSAASQREHQLKRLSRTAKLALIESGGDT